MEMEKLELGIDPPELTATGNDNNITLDWNNVDINIDRERNNRELSIT